LLAATIAILATPRAHLIADGSPRASLFAPHVGELRIAAEDMGHLWNRTKILLEWFAENNSVQWLLLHSTQPSQPELIDARRRVGIAEMYQLGLLRPASAKDQLEKAEALVAKTEPTLRGSVALQAESVEQEIRLALENVELDDQAEKKQFNKIESDLDRLIDRLESTASQSL
jgi:hypothetical protein